MKPFASQRESLTQSRHSFCLSMTMTFALMFVMMGLAQAATMPITCSPDGTTDVTIQTNKPPGDYQIEAGSQCRTVRITRSDVTLDLNNSVISGPGVGIEVCPEVGVGVLGCPMEVVKDKVSNVSIFNGTVVGSQFGIHLVQADNCNVLTLTLIGNMNNIGLDDSNRNTIIDNTISASRSEAIRFNNSHNNNLSRNQVIDNGPFAPFEGGAAIQLFGSNRNIIAFNDVLRNDQGGVGVGAAPPSFENTILNNQISENGRGKPLPPKGGSLRQQVLLPH
jgi:parallel beta-helix repeat protein